MKGSAGRKPGARKARPSPQPSVELDAIDRRILRLLQGDGRISNHDMANKIGLSPSPCLRRVRLLEQAGYVKRYVALVDPDKVGLPINIFALVSVDARGEGLLDRFEQTVSKRTEVMECFMITGEADYVLRIVMHDMEEYERFLKEFLTRIPGVAKVRSSIAFKPVVYRTELPV